MRHILIADDHEVTRRGLRGLLCEAFTDLDVVEADDTAKVLSLVRERRWDLILLDVLMPGLGIVETLKHVRATDASVPVLVVTAATETAYAVEVMRGGARGIVHKHRAADELLAAVQRVLDGQTYLHGETAMAIAETLAESLRQAPALPHERLSEREREIFVHIARGLAVKQIAADLGLSESTVTTYLARIREKTGLGSRVDIARYALTHRLVD